MHNNHIIRKLFSASFIFFIFLSLFTVKTWAEETSAEPLFEDTESSETYVYDDGNNNNSPSDTGNEDNEHSDDPSEDETVIMTEEGSSDNQDNTQEIDDPADISHDDKEESELPYESDNNSNLPADHLSDNDITDNEDLLSQGKEETDEENTLSDDIPSLNGTTSGEGYITFSSEDTFAVCLTNTTWDGTLEYSTDTENWIIYDTAYDNKQAALDNTDNKYKIYFRGYGNSRISVDYDISSSFVLSDSEISCSGNIETLLDYQTVLDGNHPVMGTYCFYELFSNCTSLVQAPNLLANTLVSSCYSNMFSGCTSVTIAPRLPATVLANYCYEEMFLGCTSLTQAPELPATSLKNGCYSDMFKNCSSLIQAPELPSEYLRSSCYSGMFSGCSSLTQVPELPANELEEHCYSHMFSGCINLAEAPELPATTLTNYCYSYMFSGCINLAEAPELPATTLADACYQRMFENCTSLASVPSLPATVLADYCYSGMFSGCINLAEAPDLPATALSDACYQRMFENCTSLASVPSLPATVLADYCYSGMFSNCTSLIQAPELPATTLANSCYSWMFSNCTSLESIPVLQATVLADYCYECMFYDCTSIKLSSIKGNGYDIPFRIPAEGMGTTGVDSLRNMFKSTGGSFKGTPIINTIYYLYDKNSDNGYITFSSDFPFTVTLSNKKWDGTVQYSSDLLEWADYTTANSVISSNSENKLFFRGIGNTRFATSFDEEHCSSFILNGSRISCSGNIETLLDYQIVIDGGHPYMDSYCYANLFSNCINLITTPQLQATYLSVYCYYQMFKGCSLLSEVPKLNATYLADHCYDKMFKDCTSLTIVPQFPATGLANYCYTNMFDGCTSLKLSVEKGGGYNTPFRIPSKGTGSTGIDSVKDMFANTGGTFIGTPEINTIYYLYGDYPVPEGNYITFSSDEPFNVALSVKCWDGTLQYSSDTISWSNYIIASTLIPAVFDNKDGKYKLFFRGINNTRFTSSLGEEASSFILSGINISCSGNIETLLDFQTVLNDSHPVLSNYCFSKLFFGCSSLIQAPDLPSTTLSYACYQSMFENCTSLTQAPELPAEVLTSRCYSSMFSGCTSLISAPALPATMLADACYSCMFLRCTSLASAPALPATALASYCYSGLFSSCTSLTSAPALPATSLDDSCYDGMFENCTSLTQAPELPAEVLTSRCYYEMFDRCTSLASAPALPATMLADYCYSGMFENCTSLTQAPELPVTTLTDHCYESMFENCTSLEQIPDLSATILADYCYYRMFRRCSSIKLSTTKVDGYDIPFRIPAEGDGIEGTDSLKDMFLNTGGSFTGTPEIDTTYYVYDESYAPEGSYITFSSDKPFTVALSSNYSGNKSWNGTLFYSTDTIFWEIYSQLDDVKQAVLDEENNEYKIYFRGKGITRFINSSIIESTFFVLNGSNISCSGNIETILDYQTVISGNHPKMDDNCFFRLFNNCTSLSEAPELPAVVLSKGCYNLMFSGCTSLIQAPELPATDLTDSCYASMFSGCTSLTQAPELPAKKMKIECYWSMFSGCTSLIQTPELPATELAGSCYRWMFSNCSSLIKAPELPATSLARRCYMSMFSGCRSLVDSPELPAEILAEQCYYGMFNGCTSLESAPELPAVFLADSCYYRMFNKCTALTNTPQLPATILAKSCYNEMFSGCTSLTDAPELPAVILPSKCYLEMFDSCTSLKISKTPGNGYNIPYRIPASGTGTVETNSLVDMFFNTGGTFTGTPDINTTYYLYDGRFTVSFESNGGSDIDSLTGLTAIPEQLPEPVKEGYNFEGWYTDEELNNRAVSGSELTKDITLYANYTPSTDTAYTVNHYQQNANDDGFTLRTTQNLTGITDSTATAVPKSYTGFTCDTSIEGTVSSGTIAADGSLTLKLYYRRNTHTLTVNNGTGIASSTGAGNYKYGQSVTIRPSLKSGYRNPVYTGDKTSSSFTMPDQDITVNINASPISYTITYALNGGSLPSGKTNPDSYTVESANITLNNPSKEGYTFKGWTGSNGNTPSKTVTISKGSTGNLAYIANWTINKYTVYFVPDNGSNIFYQVVDYNNKAAKPSPDPKKQNYIFIGWYLKDDLYDFDSPVIEEIGLIAKYEKEDPLSSFIRRLYRLCLNREADAGGLNYYKNALEKGQMSAADCVRGFFASPEMERLKLSDDEFVRRCYRVMMGREADDAGLEYWKSFLDKGVSRMYVVRGFVGSNEFTRICNSYGVIKGDIALDEPRDSNVGVTEFVVRCYTKALGRQYEVEGLNYHCNRILSASNKKAMALEVASNGFFHAPEFIRKGLSDEEYIKVLYRTFLGREAEPDGLSYYLGRLAREKDRDILLSNFANSPEFSNIMKRYGIE